MHRHGWNLLFLECLIEQLQTLEANANVKLFNALAQLMLETVSSGPDREEYRQGNTMGAPFRHWRRAKIGRRFRVFFRFDSRSRLIIFAWVNDESTLRSSGSRTDPCVVFQKMLKRGHPADDWATLRTACAGDWK